MNLLVPWIPAFVMGGVLFIAALILRVHNLRIERREEEEKMASQATSNSGA